MYMYMYVCITIRNGVHVHEMSSFKSDALLKNYVMTNIAKFWLFVIQKQILIKQHATYKKQVTRNMTGTP